MAADAGLISSFGKLATAGKRDYSGVLQEQREQGKILSKGITDITKVVTKQLQDKRLKQDIDNKAKNETIKKNINEDEKTFKKRSQQVYDSLYSEGGIGKWFGDAVYSEVSRVKNKDFAPYNTGDDNAKNTKAKQEAMGSLAKVTDQVVKFRGDLMIITKDYAENQVSPSMSAEDRNFIQAIIGTDDNRENVNTSFKNGELYFDVLTPAVIDPISLAEIAPFSIRSEKASDLTSIFRTKNAKGQTAILKTQKAAKDWGNNANNQNVEYPLQLDADNIKTSVFEGEGSSDDGFSDLAQRKLDGYPKQQSKNDTGRWDAGSWASSLQDHPSLNMAVYTAANVKVDGILEGEQPDGKVSQAEAEAVMNSENRDKVINTLVESKAPGFNRELSISEYSMFIAEGNKQAAEDAQTAKFGSNNSVNEVVNESITKGVEFYLYSHHS